MWQRAVVMMMVLAFGAAVSLHAEETAAADSSNEAAALKVLNEGKISELVKVSGIGKVTAKAIVSHREKNGAFKQLADLFKVTNEKGKPVFAGTVKKPGKRYAKACAALKAVKPANAKKN